MSFLLKGKQQHCAISGKEIRDGDYALLIPTFESHSDDPVNIFSESIVLRNEFEGWALRDEIIGRVREPCTEWYRGSRSYKVLVDTEYFLLARSLVEEKLRLFFQQHIFGLEINAEAWPEFCRQVNSLEKGEFEVHPGTSLAWDKSSPAFILLVRNAKDGLDDAIKIPAQEWATLQETLSAVPVA
jgi:hypothetical protein